MYAIVFIAGLGLASILFLIWSVATSNRDTKRGARMLGGVLLGLTALVAVGNSFTIVETRHIGIVKEFNKATGRTTGAGLNWHAPWQQIDEWNAANNLYDRGGDKCVWLTVVGPRQVCIPVQVQWESKSNRAPENWASYREEGNKTRFQVFTERQVDPQIYSVLITLFSTYDPMAGADPETGAVPAPDLNGTHKDKFRKALEEALGADIRITGIAFGAPVNDQKTAEAMAAYGQKVLEKRNLEIDKDNAQLRLDIAKKQAEGGERLWCLQIAKDGGKEPGWCMSGDGVTTTRALN